MFVNQEVITGDHAKCLAKRSPASGRTETVARKVNERRLGAWKQPLGDVRLE